MNYPLKPNPSLHAETKTWKRSGWVLFAAVLAVVLTARLGFWQLGRAEEKIAWQAEVDALAAKPELLSSDLMAQPDLWQQTHRRVRLHGTWLTDKTVLLDNRNHQGQAGFWVLTPLQWQPGEVVWVQRGWVARDPVSAHRSGPFQTPQEAVDITARIAASPTAMTVLKDSPPVAEGSMLILNNLDKAQMQAMVQSHVSGFAVELGDNSEGLRRDWPLVAATADKNQAYAFQWFALSALVAGLYVWFQWIRPSAHATHNT